MRVGPRLLCRTVQLISLCVYLTPRPVMFGNSVREWCTLRSGSTTPYQIQCPPCERGWCFWRGGQARYQSLPHGTCKEHWILVWSGPPLPDLTMSPFWVSTGLGPLPATTSGPTHTDTHTEHTRIEYSMNTAQNESSRPE